jgi:hypothetical protein
MTKILTVYPQGWFGRSTTAKQHAFLYEGDLNKHGSPVYPDDYPSERMRGKRMDGSHTPALCGATGTPSGNEFTATEPNVITCSRCVKRANAIREAAR